MNDNKMVSKLTFFALMATIATTFFATTQPSELSDSDKRHPWITVFVHGIMSIKPHINVGNVLQFIRDDINDTLYAKTVEYMREDPIFFQNQPMQAPGMHIVDKSTVVKGNASGAMAYLLDELRAHYNLQPRDNIYYTFGWSGLLSAKRRYADAIDLFKALEQLQHEYNEKGIFPKFRVLGYSHGGNIVLNLGLVRQKEFPHSHFHIDEAILIGMPVQAETDYLINDPVFNKIFHFYSKKDRVQQMDLFSSNRFFSDRLFRPRKGFDLPEKLTQIKIKVIRPSKRSQRRPHKIELGKRFENPRIITARSSLVRNVSPGHSELWFFGWTPMHYRHNFPLYPLPASAYIPLILHNIRELDKKTTPEHSLVADIRPAYDAIILRQSRQRKAYKILPTLTEQKRTQIIETLMMYAPEEYTPKKYARHIRAAYKKAKYFYHVNENKQACTRCKLKTYCE